MICYEAPVKLGICQYQTPKGVVRERCYMNFQTQLANCQGASKDPQTQFFGDFGIINFCFLKVNFYFPRNLPTLPTERTLQKNLSI